MGLTTAQLPDASPSIALSYNIAVEIVYSVMQCFSSLIYDQCVYNLAADTLVNIAQDQPGQTIFADLRKSFSLNTFIGGVISSSADVSTSESMATPDFVKTLTLANLQQLKTPWGRQYLAYAQSAGPLWGLS
jgi:hypothetical protein